MVASIASLSWHLSIVNFRWEENSEAAYSIMKKNSSNVPRREATFRQ